MATTRTTFLSASLAAAFAAASLPSAAQQQRDPFMPLYAPTGEVRVAIDVRPGNNMPVVKCAIEGRPLTMLFDTGATHTTLDEGFVRRELPDRTLEKVMLAGITNVEQAPSLFHADSFKVGDAEFSDFSVMVLPLGHLESSVGVKVDGIIGMNVIGRVWTLVSFGAGEAYFMPARARVVGEGSLGFSKQAPRIAQDPFSVLLKATHADRPFTLIVDSAASITMLSESVGWPASGESVTTSVSDVNASGSGMSSRLGAEGELELGVPLRIRPVIVPGSTHDANRIGADTLRRYDLLVGPFGRGAAFRPYAPQEAK